MESGAGGVIKGKSKLVVPEGRQNSDHYIYTLSEQLLPFAHKNYGQCLIHSSNETRLFFREIGLLNCSTRSPNFNRIENVWAIPVRKVYVHGKRYNTVSGLTAAVMKTWDSITMIKLQNILDTIPAHCFEVAHKNRDKIHCYVHGHI
ncbi:LOW QUALITY PROTEIN: Transposase [Phytophthora megakarya]|uniref:Transposase n=1 Tax=Phytophthora megakarya TaxID=4795 RepID=A0A225VW61_9STRA|nr:LOW QUALITY PROTEIN: Transposase [Phytophthora megakarya]